MRFYVRNSENEKLPLEIVVVHYGEDCIFSIGKLGRRSFYDKSTGIYNDIFKYVNEYIRELEISNVNAVNDMFILFKDIETIFKTVSDRHELKNLLKELSGKIIDLMNYSNVLRWTLSNPNIILPVKVFSQEFVETIDSMWTRDQTYTLPEYRELLALSITLRPILPIWGEYINQLKDLVGTDLKEYYSFSIIDNHPILDVPSFIKLKTYVNKTIDVNSKGKLNLLTTLSFISQEELPDLILSLVVIRRLCIGNIDVDPNDEKATLVSYIYQHVRDRIDNDYNQENPIKEKQLESSTEIDEKLSVFDLIKIKHNLAIGTIVEIEFYLSDIYRIAKNLNYTGTKENLDLWLSFGQRLENNIISDISVILSGWLIGSVISPKALQYISRDKIDILRNIISLSACIMWDRGFHYLSLLTLSIPKVIDNNYFLATGIDTRSQLSKNYVIELDRLFPLYPINPDKKIIPKNSNIAIKSIEKLTTDISRHTWTTVVDSNLYKQLLIDIIQVRSDTNEITAIPDIRNYLAVFIIHAQEEKRKKYQ